MFTKAVGRPHHPTKRPQRIPEERKREEHRELKLDTEREEEGKKRRTEKYDDGLGLTA